MTILENIKEHPSLKQMAFRAIKEAIINNKLRPGEIYTEQKLAKELGVSKTPVREALLDLGLKGFVNYLPRKGFQISLLTEKEIHNLYVVRRALETAALQTGLSKLTAQDIIQIETIHEREEGAIKTNDRHAYMRIDRELHYNIAKLSENGYLINSLENIRDLVDWMGFMALSRQGRIVEAREEHHRIIEKIKDRDLDGAIQSMELHSQLTEQNVLQMLQKS